MHIVMNLMMDESGAAAIEYGLIAGLISAVIIGPLSAVGQSITNVFNTVSNTLEKANLASLP